MKDLDISRAKWRKSSRSGGNGQCVETARIVRTVVIRDSKAPYEGFLSLSPAEFGALLGNVKAGRYDLT